MVSLPKDRIKQLEKRFEIIESQMAQNPDAETYVKLASEYAELQPIVSSIQTLSALYREITDLETLIGDKLTDTEMRHLAQEELPLLCQKMEQLEQKLQILLLPKDVADEKVPLLKFVQEQAVQKLRFCW